jgi:hypothetical protein
MTRRSAETRSKNVLKFRRERIGLQMQLKPPPTHKEAAMPNVERTLARLRAENAELRARAVELMLEIRTRRG